MQCKAMAKRRRPADKSRSGASVGFDEDSNKTRLLDPIHSLSDDQATDEGSANSTSATECDKLTAVDTSGLALVDLQVSLHLLGGPCLCFGLRHVYVCIGKYHCRCFCQCESTAWS